jgi:transglutaminase-like putative cysteine protease
MRKPKATSRRSIADRGARRGTRAGYKAPNPGISFRQQDPYSNYQVRLVFPGEKREFVIEVALVADLAVTNPFDFFLGPPPRISPSSTMPRLSLRRQMIARP